MTLTPAPPSQTETALQVMALTPAEERMVRRIRQLRRQGDAAVLLLLAPLTLCVVGDEEIIERPNAGA